MVTRATPVPHPIGPAGDDVRVRTSAGRAAPASARLAVLGPEHALQLQYAVGNRALGHALDGRPATHATPTVMRQELPRADLGARDGNRAWGLDWESSHRQIEQDGTLREAFEANLATELARHFGEEVTRDEVLTRISTAEEGGDAAETARLRRLLARANQFAVVATLNVEASARYEAQGARGTGARRTYCNIYAYDVVTALGAYLPRVWWTPAAIRRLRAGEDVAVRYGVTVTELNANALTNWMPDHGVDYGWSRAADLSDAQDAANDGKVVVMLAAQLPNARGRARSGHITVVMPEIRATDDVRDTSGAPEVSEAGRDESGAVTRPMQSQAGGTNEEYGDLGAGWLTAANYRDGAAWIFEGRRESALLTPEQQGATGDEVAPAAEGPAEVPGRDETAESGGTSEGSAAESSSAAADAAPSFDVERAVRRNDHWGTELGWLTRVDGVVAYFQNIEILPAAMSPSPELLARAIFDYQGLAGLTTDGIMGRNTWESVARYVPDAPAAVADPVATEAAGPATAAAAGPAGAEAADLPAAAAGEPRDWTAVSAEDRMAYVVGRLVDVYGMPVEGAAGLVGNLSEESGVLPSRIEGSRGGSPMTAPEFGGGRREFTPEEVMNRDRHAEQGPRLAGTGLAQWTSADRRRGLFEHEYEGRVLGAAILHDMDAQVDYLVTELQADYRGVYRTIMAGDLEDSSDDVVYGFERPGAIIEDRSRLPRSDPRVQEVFDRRRRASRRALAAYRAGTE